MQKIIDSATLDPATLVDQPAIGFENPLLTLTRRLLASMGSIRRRLRAQSAHPVSMRTAGARPILPSQFIDELRGRD
jgi:hypothetical protein